LRDFRRKEDSGPKWRREHTQMIMLVAIVMIFALLVWVLVTSAKYAETPPRE
jgi:hypothetical protein